jgi:hypothetical protein
MYGISEESFNESKYLVAGINENVRLVSIVREASKKDGTGQQVLRFYFDKQGYSFVHTEFPVDEQKLIDLNRAKSDSKLTDAEAIKKGYTALSRNISHILGTFVPKDKIIFDITEKNPEKAWEAFCDKVIEIAGKAYENHLFRIALVYNSKDFVTFKKIPIFIQNMKEPNAIKFNHQYDRITPLAPKDDVKEEVVDWNAPSEVQVF